MSLRCTIFDLDDAFKGFYKRIRNYPKIKSKLRNARKYITDEITKTITDTYDIIVTETLNIKNMVKNHKLAKSLTDVTLVEIMKKLEYKVNWKGKKIYVRIIIRATCNTNYE